MLVYMPQIYWFDNRSSIMCIDVQPITYPPDRPNRQCQRVCERFYKIATVGVQKDVRIWEFCFEEVEDAPAKLLQVDFVANLDGHHRPLNCCRWAPNGQLLATGDVDGGLIVWYHDDDERITIDPTFDYEFPPNLENWKPNKKLRRYHDSDVTCMAWSPDSQFIASGSNDDSIVVHNATTGERLWQRRGFRHFPIGLSWDPRGKYVTVFSTDRRLDVLSANKGVSLRTIHAVEGLNLSIGDISTQEGVHYKLFHDDQLIAFKRSTDFSPCGSLFFVPTAHLEIGGDNIYGTYVYKRTDLDSLKPQIMLPSTKPTIAVRCSPIVYKLVPNTRENFLGLPYRVIYAVMTKEAVFVYDSQHSNPIAYLGNLHYDSLTSVSWTPDGKHFVVSSLEGYNSFVNFSLDSSFVPTTMPELASGDENTTPDSPVLQRLPKKSIAATTAANSTDTSTPTRRRKSAAAAATQQPPSTPTAPPKTPEAPTVQGTPKSSKKNTLLKFFTPVTKNEQQQPAAEGTPTPAPASTEAPKKKRVQLIKLDD